MIYRRPAILALCAIFLLFLGLPLAATTLRVSAAQYGPFPLISRDTASNTPVPAYASSGTARDGNSSDYSTFWEPSSMPAWLAYDLSNVPTSQRGAVVVSWYNDPYTSDYWQGGGIGNSYYDLPQDYTIDANAAPGGGSPPTSGWVILLSVTGNSYSGRMHRVNFSGFTWLRINITASRGGRPDIKMDVYDASQGVADTLLMLGDSITAEGTAHSNISLSGQWNGGNLTQLINTANPAHYPSILDGGTGGVTALWGATYISSLLAPYSGHYVALDYGTNDANQNGALTTQQVADFYNNMLTMVDAALARGMVPIIPHIPWGCASSGWLGANAKTLNDYLDAHLYIDRPQVIRGPDLWTFFHNNPSLLSDCIHPTYTASSGQLNGYEQYQRQWRDSLLSTIFSSNSSSPTPTTPTGSPIVPTATDTPIPPTATGTPTSVTGPSTATTSPTPVPSTSTPTIIITRAPPTSTPPATFTPVPATSTPTGAPRVTLSPTSLAFGSQLIGTAGAPQSVTLTNSGAGPLTISTISILGTGAADFAQTTTCPLPPAALAADGSCTISVTFKPTASGNRTATLSIADNAATSPQSVSLSGMGKRK